MRFRKQDRKQSGMTAVEFALIAPIVIVLLLGFVECGNLFYSWLTTYKAAQTATRFAATGQGYEDGNRMALIEQQVSGVMSRLSGGATSITISSWPQGAFAGDGTSGDAGCPCGMVQVEVGYDYQPITPFLGDLLPSVIAIAGSDRKINEPWYRCD